MAQCTEDLKAKGKEAILSDPVEPAAPKVPLEGGFEVEIVNPPTELQWECPVCLQVLCEPYQATCCGYSYCKTCITRLKNNKQPCPACNDTDYEIFPDKRLKRSLTSYHVRCQHQAKGCDWVGELGELERHLNANPQPEAVLTGCGYQEVKCHHCEEFFMRKDLAEHESKCLFRPYVCEYCKDYNGTCHDVTVNHWPVCPRRPVPCPNNCGVYPERRDLQYHTENDCGNAILKCPFAYAGCAMELPAGEMEGHLRDSYTQHIKSMASSHQELLTQLSDLKLTLEASAMKISQLDKEKQEMQTMMDNQNDTILQLQNDLGRFRLRQEANKRDIQALQEHSAIAPIIFTLDNFEGRLKRRDMGWSPAPFYTHPHGYKMLLCVDVYGNGTGKGTHMSVFLSLLKGEFDEHLKWPFRASIMIRLENQEEDENHYQEVIKYHDNTPEVTAGRIFEEGRQGRPWGKGKFIAHNELYTKYLKDDCLRIGIGKVMLH